MTAFDVLSDPTRRQVVESLRHGERAVGEIVALVGIDQSGVSRHLRILAEAGFVHRRPDGPRRLYSLNPRPFRELQEWLAGYEELWQGRLDRFDAQLKQRRRAKNDRSAP